jgi:hypothetical protein
MYFPNAFFVTAYPIGLDDHLLQPLIYYWRYKATAAKPITLHKAISLFLLHFVKHSQCRNILQITVVDLNN